MNPASAPPELLDADVHVWWLSGELAIDALSADELERMARFRRDGDRRRFALRRAGLRQVLARYTSIDPAALRFVRSCEHCGHPDHGRPRLAQPTNLSFSTASRADRAVVAVAPAPMSVGVDLEPVDPGAGDAIVTAALTDDERDSVDPSDHAALFRLWCRKEAVLKAMGYGLAGPSPPSRLDARDDVIAGWHVADLPAPRGWAAALATAVTMSEIHQFSQRSTSPFS